jgi:hypothetical protein
LNQKHSSLAIFFILWLPTVVFYLLQTSGIIGDWIQTAFYIIVSVASLVVLLVIKSDEPYYENLNPLYLILAVIVGLLMTAVSWGLSLKLGESLLSVGYTTSFIAAPSSTVTIFLSLMLFGLVMPATAEELMKLAGFAELKARFSKTQNGKTRWYGAFIYVGFPVGFWALLHGIQAYTNLLQLVPAFINGILLIVFLWKTRCIFAVILAHWEYNAGIILLTFIRGKYDLPAGTPTFPSFSSITIADIAVVILILVWIGLFVFQAMRNKVP